MFGKNFYRNHVVLCTLACFICSCAQVKTLFDGSDEAKTATTYFSQGNFEKADEYTAKALKANPNQPQALLIGALVAEATSRPNKARANYEQLILQNDNTTTVLTTADMVPVKISEIAQKRLRLLNIKNSEVIVEDIDGNKVFTIKKDAAIKQNKSAMEEALFVKEAKNINNSKSVTEANVKAIEILFSDDEKNTISRFLILKELAENNLITKDEFLVARTTNLGGLLPLTNIPPAAGLNNPVPTPDIITERIGALKEGMADRTITAKEFSAERNLIVEALMPKTPRTRITRKAPSKDILTAAKDLRKLEVLYELNLITTKEKQAEKSAVEKHLGLNKVEPQPITAPPAPPSRREIIELKAEMTEQVQAPSTPKNEIIISEEIKVEELSAIPSQAKKAIVPSTPEVSSPF